MASDLRGIGKDNATAKTPTAGEGDHQPARLVKWENEPSNGAKDFPLKLADAPNNGDKAPPPGYLTVHYDPATGLNKPVGNDVVHLTIDSDKGINMATNLLYGQQDAQGRPIPPHFHTVIGQPDDRGTTTLRGQFDVTPNLQDVTLHYKDAQGLTHNQTYQASSLRLEGTANAINPYVNDFKAPDQQRPISQQYPGTNSVYEFGYRMSDMSGRALGFLEQNLLNDKAHDKSGNPYIDINLAEARVGLAVQHYLNSSSTRFDDQTRAREKEYAMVEIAEAKKNYDSAVVLGQKQMQALPNPGDISPHNHLDPLHRRFAPQRPYGQDYYPLVYGSAIDTANWRRMQLDVLQGIMSVNGKLPPRQSNRIDQP